MLARQGSSGQTKDSRTVIAAHIDAKRGTPGAVDDATGIAVLLLLADLRGDHDGESIIELVAFNGEDYYAAPGELMTEITHTAKDTPAIVEPTKIAQIALTLQALLAQRATHAKPSQCLAGTP